MADKKDESKELTGFEKFALLTTVAVIFIVGVVMFELINHSASTPNYMNCESIGNPTTCENMPDPSEDYDNTVWDINKNYPEDSH